MSLIEVLGVVATLVFEVVKWTVTTGALEDTVEVSQLDQGLRNRLSGRIRASGRRVPDKNSPGS